MYDYIKILSSKEKREYITFLKNKTDQNISKSKIALQNNRDILLQAYIDYENKIIEEYKTKLREFKKKESLWIAKECLCGKKLRFIENYDFWGCPDYKSNTRKKHITFKNNQSEVFEYQYANIRVRLSHNWSTDILRKSNLQSEIKAKELLLFYSSEGLEDLRAKYGYKNSLKSISSYVVANKESKKEEKEIKQFLSKFFESVKFQLYIKYKRVGGTEKIRIIDLIVSDNSNVFLIEIKRHNIYIDKEQITLYRSLIKGIMKQHNDKRKLTSLFIVNEYYESEYNDNQCVLFEELKQKKNKLDVIKLLQKSNFD